MSERRKRQRVSESGTAVFTASSDTEAHLRLRDSKGKPRKETNASARRSLFVRSLPATVSNDALTELFSANYPLKHATIVLDPTTKQSKGYGFVTLTDADDAERAKAEFDGYTLQGRKIKVEIAEPRHREIATKNEVGGKRKSSQLLEALAAKKAREEKLAEARRPPKLIVRNLPWSIKEPEQLAALFRKYGKVKHSTLPKTKSNTQTGFGFVVIRGKKNAEKALAEVNGLLVDGRTLAVDWAVEKDVWEGQKDVDSAINGKEDAEYAENEGEGSQGDEEDGGIPFDTDDDVANFMRNRFDDLEDEHDEDDKEELSNLDAEEELEDDSDGWIDEDGLQGDDEKPAERVKSPRITDNSSTLFVRNLPFTTLDADLKEQFMQFGPVRYARVVMDRNTDRPKGTGFICFFNVEDAEKCYRGAPMNQFTGANGVKRGEGTASLVKHSVLENEDADITGKYSMEGRILQIARAVNRDQAVKLTEEGTKFRDGRDKDKRRLYLLSEGTVAAGTPLYEMLAPSEVKTREESAMQRKKLIQNNPTLHLSLTRLSIRNIPHNITSKDLKALAREAVVGFAKDVKSELRAPLSKEEEARGGEEMRSAEKHRKAKGKGIVKQSKIVFEGREGSKVSEESGAGRSRGYGFVEYSSHRWALMGLRWLNGHALESNAGKKHRLIVEFAIENAQVVSRRKENELKARIRSKEVLEARARGEAPEKEKKVLSRDAQMANTRKGGKAAGKHRPGFGKGKGAQDGRPARAVSGVKRPERTQSFKRKRDNDGTADGKGASSRRESNGEEKGKLAKRQQIIGQKRAKRKAGKGSGS